MTGIRITTLGSLHIERDGEEIRDLPAQPVRCALFLYLAIERVASRDQLAEILWPERDAERARHSLSQTLYELRRRLGDEWLEADAERVRVTEVVSVDARDFVAAVEHGRDSQALALYEGAFLGASHVGTTKEFESWVDRQRSYLGRLYREVCRRLTAAHAEAGDLDAALAVASGWADRDPLDDEAQHRVIELLAQTGRRSEALRRYDEYEGLIARELDVQPLDETKELVARLRGGVGHGGRVEAPRAPAAATPLAGERQGPLSSGGPPLRVFRRWGIDAAVAAGAVAVAAGAIYLWNGSEPSAEALALSETAPSIAVLPFVNMSQDPEQEYFSDGITEDLITSLSGIQGLRVISRTSVMSYKGRGVPLPEIAGALGVKYVLEGSVRREGNQVRITAQLVDAVADAHLWAHTYDRELTGIFEIQRDIAAQIAEALEHHLSADARARIASGGTSSVLAYDMYLRGMGYLQRPGSGDVRKYEPAMNFFRRALQVDPEYARAYVGLSSAFRLHVGLPDRLRRDSAIAYAQRAVALEPRLSVALSSLGAAYVFADDLPSAEEMLERTLRLDPNNTEAIAGLAQVASRKGRFDEAVRWAARAVAVDPSSSARNNGLGIHWFNLGDLSGAQAAYQGAIDLSPDFPQPAYELAMIHLFRGEAERADETMRKLLTHASDHPGARYAMGRYLAQIGRYEEAGEYLSGSALGDDPIGTVPYRAYVAIRTGERERAAELLGFMRDALAQREREGVRVGRLKLSLQALSGDREGALATFAENLGPGLRGGPGPQIGIYWVDRDPLLYDIVGDPRFQKLLAEMRASLDSMRALLPEDLYRNH